MREKKEKERKRENESKKVDTSIPLLINRFVHIKVEIKYAH